MKLLQVQSTTKRAKSFFFNKFNQSLGKITTFKNKPTFNFDTASSIQINHAFTTPYELLTEPEQIQTKIISSLSISPSKSSVSPQRYRKNSCGEIIKVKKIFNRTETDYLHNFVGAKYLQKIKQQIKSSKYHNFGSKYERARKEHLKIASKLDERIFQIQQDSQTISEKWKSKEQNESPNKLIKQKRKCRAKIVLNSKIVCSKQCMKDEEEGRNSKIDQLSPWGGSTLCYWVAKK